MPTWILTNLTVDARFARYWIPAVQAATQIPRRWKGERSHCTALSETFKNWWIFFLWKSERNRFCFSYNLDRKGTGFLKPLRCRPCWVPCASDMLQRPCEVSRDYRASPGGKKWSTDVFSGWASHADIMQLIIHGFKTGTDWWCTESNCTNINPKLSKKKNLTRFTHKVDVLSLRRVAGSLPGGEESQLRQRLQLEACKEASAVFWKWSVVLQRKCLEFEGTMDPI